MTKDEIMDAGEVCDILGIKKGTLYTRRWRKSVQIPVFRQGKYLFAIRKVFFKWYEKRQVFV